MCRQEGFAENRRTKLRTDVSCSALLQDTYRSSSRTASCLDGEFAVPPQCSKGEILTALRLINYTPQATIVRLLSINAVNAYTTSTVLALAGGFTDPRLLLPGWIGIATVSYSFHSSTWNRLEQMGLTRHHFTDPHSLLPHHASEDQHSQRNVHFGQRFLHC